MTISALTRYHHCATLRHYPIPAPPSAPAPPTTYRVTDCLRLGVLFWEAEGMLPTWAQLHPIHGMPSRKTILWLFGSVGYYQRCLGLLTGATA